MFRNTFLQEHPEYKLLSDAPQDDIDVLMWAHDARYIRLDKTPDRKYVYTDFDLECAKMWRNKV